MRIIIDANNIGYAMFHAMGPDKIAFGFLKQIVALSKTFETNRFIFCWDSKHSYRKTLYPAYKSNRRKDLDPFQQSQLKLAFQQFNKLREEILPALGFQNVFMQDGYEADDLIAWITYRCPDQTTIVSSDHDLWQLLTDDKFNPVQIYTVAKKKTFTVAGFRLGCEGLEPTEWATVKAMAGCSGDNVAGIVGVGELTAIRYLTGLLPDGKIKKKIDTPESKELITRNLPLVFLPFGGEAPIQISLDEKEVFSKEGLKRVFRELGFMSFLKGDVEQWGQFHGKGGKKQKQEIDKPESISGTIKAFTL